MSTSPSPAEEYAEIEQLTRLVEGTTDWDAPSPVADWSARDVVRHLVDWFPAFVSGGDGVKLPGGPSVDADPVRGLAGPRRRGDGAARRPGHRRQGPEQPAHRRRSLPDAVSRFFTADVFMHSWDLARDDGPGRHPRPGARGHDAEGMEPIDEMLGVAAGSTGARVPVPDDAPVQPVYVAFIGRDPPGPRRPPKDDRMTTAANWRTRSSRSSAPPLSTSGCSATGEHSIGPNPAAPESSG